MTKNLLWRAYYYLFVQEKISHFKHVDLAKQNQLFSKSNIRFSKINSLKYFFKPSEINKIRELEISVLINFDLGFLVGDILETPTHGVWSFHHGDEDVYRGLPPGFWEIFHNIPVAGIVLQRLTDKLDAGYILEKGFVPTNNRSLTQSLEILFSAGVDWPAKICRLILATNLATNIKKSKTKTKVYKAPNNGQMLQFFVKIIWRNFIYLLTQYFYAESWQVGVLACQPGDLLTLPIENFKPIWLPHETKSSFEADPFGYGTQNGERIIFESFDYKKSRGEISSTAFDPMTNSFSKPRLEISKSYHLSYPFTFEYINQTFCLIENYTEHKMDYFVLDQNEQWQEYLQLPLKKGRNDQTLHQHNGLWYLFYTDGLHGANFNLQIEYSESPFGPFKSHLLNPIKVDIRSARSAGRIFNHREKLYRPSQNSKYGYGAAISLFEIKKLSPTEYAEVFVREIIAPRLWGQYFGLHTISKLSNTYILIDCKSYKFIGAHALRLLRRRLYFDLSRSFKGDL
ncbi:MAG: hypothetical protein H7061_04680 [Bdellovibrionaceae bacterium]|nr:hypothetical protein [Bdellovibrio sp.]